MTCYNSENFKNYYPPTRFKKIGVAFETVRIPASLGDSTTYPPKLGLYTNKIVKYEADDTVWLYDSLSNYTQIGNGGGSSSVVSVNGKTGAVVLKTSDLENDSDYVTGTFVTNAISEETTAREGEDARIEGKVDDVADDLADEVAARQGADNNLQGQIDAITASSDVTDIVGTYAELQAYDTSTLGDRDIIKVLQDESRNDETTYYRWSTTTQTFTLIGEEGPYYTKSAADTKFQDKLTAGANIAISANNEISATDTTYSAGSGLSLSGTEFSVDTTTIQPKLTAGANISISGDTISATDTTYSDFTGTDGVDPGTSGLVPAPAATDDGKFLKSDGTWDTAGSAINVVQTTGTSTTDVMSQEATSSLIYPEGYEISHNNILMGDGARMSIPSQTGNVMIYGVQNTGYRGIAIGKNSQFGSNDCVAIGGGSTNGARALASQSVAIGTNSLASSGSYSVALGAASRTSRNYEVSIGQGSGSNPTRYVSNVTDPSLPQDAATKNYVDSFYPVGSVYMSTSSTAPTFAGGTWTNIGSQTIGSSTVYYYERTA